MGDRPKLALYWASSCGGCEVAVVNLHELFLEVCERYEFFFCPAFLDTKRSDVEALPDGGLALTLFNGAIRTDENVEMAHLLRRKSALLVAFGACAQCGGVPALSNLSTREAHFEAMYGDARRAQGPAALPQLETRVPEGVLRLPRFHERVKALAEVVAVDYTVPGCPPESAQVWAALSALGGDRSLPPRGTVLGGGCSAVCDECARTREDKALDGFRRVYELVTDPARCLLDQGLACVGPGTRGGCGALCPAVNMPCSGCYGPPEGVYDQATKLVSTLGSVLDVAELRDRRDPDEIAERVDRAIDTLPDLAGTTGKYSLAGWPPHRKDIPSP
jgi:F420-non-reducing hydrogenase small subunit